MILWNNILEEGDFKFPTGVAFHPLGYVVVVDRANSLQLFEKTGSFLLEVTKVRKWCISYMMYSMYMICGQISLKNVEINLQL